jgi:nucleoid-associated protein YgaU
MGKETKIGLAIIGVLMSALVVLLVRHFYVGQSAGQWEGETPTASQSIASPSSHDQPNVVVAQSDDAGSGTSDSLWNNTGPTSSEPAVEVPPTSYMPAEAEPDAAPDRYAIGRGDVAAEVPPAADPPLGVSPIPNRGLDDNNTGGDVQSPRHRAIDSPAKLPSAGSSSDRRRNPLRRLSAELPLDAADEASRVEPADQDDRYAIDAEPARPTDSLDAQQSPRGLEPAANEDPFGPAALAVPQADDHGLNAGDDSLPQADDADRQQPLEADSHVQVQRDEPREPVAKDWQTDSALDEPMPIGNEPLPVENGMYIVRPNDTLWSISEKVYGTGSYFKALAAHNRANLPRSDRLAVGIKIAVPQVGELAQKYPSLCPKERRSALVKPRAVRATATMPGAGGDVYVVQEGDTLFDIARYELGKASRWAEIYGLNRDTLGEDFDYLQPGVELRLPPKTRAAETISRGRESRYLR